MRLGDLDALREMIEDHETSVSVCLTCEEARAKTEFKELVLEYIDNMPTIDTQGKTEE